MTSLTTIDLTALSHVQGGFDASVENCKAAFANGQITKADLKKFGADHSYRGTTPAANACFGKAAWGGFGFSEDAVKQTFGVK
jgi:hypothetical protein